jgi:hypothetical protein
MGLPLGWFARVRFGAWSWAVWGCCLVFGLDLSAWRLFVCLHAWGATSFFLRRPLLARALILVTLFFVRENP